VTITTGSQSTSSSTSTTTTDGGAGARQTGSASTNTTTSTSTSTTPTSSASQGGTTTITSLNSLCPSNYYFCSAYFRPGCCVVGLNCALTNCVFATSTSTFVANGVTIRVPVGGSTGGSPIVFTQLETPAGPAPTAFGGGACVDSFVSCAQSFGGGCCPADFACETGASCTAVAGAGVTGQINKVAPGGAPRVGGELLGWVGVGVGALVGVAMVVV